MGTPQFEPIQNKASELANHRTNHATNRDCGGEEVGWVISTARRQNEQKQVSNERAERNRD